MYRVEFFLHSTEDKPYTVILQSLALQLNLYKVPALVFLFSTYIWLYVKHKTSCLISN